MSDDRTLGELPVLKLLELTRAELREAVRNERDASGPGPACGAYAYLSLALDKLRDDD